MAWALRYLRRKLGDYACPSATSSGKFQAMYLLLIGWLYVVLMMAVVEAASPQGSLLGAFFTLLLYGVLPVVLLMFIAGTPARRRLRHRQEQAQQDAAPTDAPN